jgi:hypothetical protein
MICVGQSQLDESLKAPFSVEVRVRRYVTMKEWSKRYKITKFEGGKSICLCRGVHEQSL